MERILSTECNRGGEGRGGGEKGANGLLKKKKKKNDSVPQLHFAGAEKRTRSRNEKCYLPRLQARRVYAMHNPGVGPKSRNFSFSGCVQPLIRGPPGG